MQCFSKTLPTSQARDFFFLSTKVQINETYSHDDSLFKKARITDEIHHLIVDKWEREAMIS